MRRTKRGPASNLLLPHGVRALVPVFGVAGGTGRSTLVGLLAQVLAPTTRTVVIDPAPRASSPWTGWLGIESAPPGHAGLPSLLVNAQAANAARTAKPSDVGRPDSARRPDPASCLRAVVGRPIPIGRRERQDLLDIGPAGVHGPGYDVLTDTRAITAAPVAVPEDPQWYAAVVEAGDWFVGVIDVGLAVPAAHVAARHRGGASALDLWWRRTDTVPIVAAPTTGDGLSALHEFLGVLDHDGLPLPDLVVGLVDTSGSKVPRRLRRQIATLDKRVLAVVEIPYDATIRTRGLTRLDRIADTTLDAARQIGKAVAGAVRPGGRRHRDDRGQPADRADEPERGGNTDRAGASERTGGAATPDDRTAGDTSAPGHQRGGWVPVRHQVSSHPYQDDGDEDTAELDDPELSRRSREP